MRVFTATLSFIFLCSSLLKAKNNLSTASLHFLENKGQVTDQYHDKRTDIDFKISSGALNVFIGNGELHYQFHKPASVGVAKGFLQNSGPIPMYRMDVSLLNANKNARIITEDKLPYYEQHYTATKPITTHSFSKIIYKDIYPSIDWVLYIKDNQLEYDFVIHKGGNAADIKLQYNGATSLVQNKDGSLTATTPMGAVTEHAPYAYQEDGALVPSSFLLNGSTVSFKTAPHKGELTIDPAVVWGTYYGGEMGADISGVDHDNTGNIYIAGNTKSISDIATVGSHQSAMIATAGMAFLVKFNTAGIRQWGTYFGGTVGEGVQDITVDPAGNIYIAGESRSSNIATPGSHQDYLASEEDAFLAKFNTNGVLQWSTYFGGDTTDRVSAITTDNTGNVYLCGFTNSTSNITTPGSFQPVMVADADAYVAKFNANGVLQWSTYYGDMHSTTLNDMCTDDNGDIYIAGHTADFNNIATPGSHQVTNAGNGDNFLVKFNTNGERIWGTYYGGAGHEENTNIGYDGMGHIYLGGLTMSTNNISTPGSHQPALSPTSTDVFLVQLDTSGVRQWGTYYGNWGVESLGGLNSGKGIIADDSGNVFIIGATTSDTSIATECSHQQFRAGSWDNFIVKFNSQGTRQWGTYHGGTAIDAGCTGIFYDGSIYVAGNTESTTGIATPGSHDETYSNSWGGDGFLFRFTDCETPQQPIGISGLTTVCEGDTVTYKTGAVCQATSFTWTLPMDWAGTSTVDSIITIAGATSGSITVSANSACGSSSAQTLAVTVNPAPVPVISITGNLLSTGNYTTYQWNLNGNPVTGATSQTYEYIQPGQYTVTVTDANGCTATSAPFSTNVKSISDERLIALYPNPNNGSFTLSLTGLPNDEEVSIMITDITGRTLQTFTGEVKDGSMSKTFDLKQNIASGQYFIKLRSGTFHEVIRFTKH